MTRPPSASRTAGHQPLEERVQALETEVEQLHRGLASRQQLGLATGIVAARFGLPPDRAWAFLLRLSGTSHVKVRDVARLVVGDLTGPFNRLDKSLAEQVDGQLDGATLFSQRRRRGPDASR